MSEQSRDELLEEARTLGLTPKSNTTKDDLQEAIAAQRRAQEAGAVEPAETSVHDFAGTTAEATSLAPTEALKMGDNEYGADQLVENAGMLLNEQPFLVSVALAASGETHLTIDQAHRIVDEYKSHSVEA